MDGVFLLTLGRSQPGSNPEKRSRNAVHAGNWEIAEQTDNIMDRLVIFIHVDIG
jgi:hypothetical protein